MVSTSGTSRARTSAASAAPASANTLRQPWPRDRRSSSPAPCLTPAPPPPPLALPDPLLHTQSAPPVEGTHCHHCPPAPSTPPTYPCTTLYQPNSTDSLASPFHTSMEEHKNAHVNPHPPPSSSVAPPHVGPNVKVMPALFCWGSILSAMTEEMKNNMHLGQEVFPVAASWRLLQWNTRDKGKCDTNGV